MQSVYESAAKVYPFLRQYDSNAAYLDGLFPRACDIQLMEIKGRGSYHWLVFQPDPESPYRVALTPAFRVHEKVLVRVYSNVRTIEVMDEAEDIARWAPAVFIPVSHELTSIDTLPAFLKTLTTSAEQPGIRPLRERAPEEFFYCCTMCFMIMYALSSVGVKQRCMCCCRRPVEEE